MDPVTYATIILPIIVFFVRIFDVSIGTIRIILITKGYKYIAPLLGFFEVLAWITIVKEIITNMQGPISLIAYAGGFATGTYVGMLIEERFMKGQVLLRVITRKEAHELVKELRKKELDVTSIDAEGNHGPVKVIFTIIDRHEIPEVVHIIKTLNPKAFYSIESVKFAVDKRSSKKIFDDETKKRKLLRLWTPHRKDK